MLNYNEIKQRAYIVYENEPWEVIESQVSRKQANKPVNKTKIKNLITGRVIEQTFHVSDKVHEADISKQDIQYLYTNPKNGERWFNEDGNPKNRFTLDENTVGNAIEYIPEKTLLQALVYTDKEGDEQIIGIKYPLKIVVEVTEAPPNIKGNTAQGGKKNVTIETGASVSTPLFIEAGQKIAINPTTGEYSERA